MIQIEVTQSSHPEALGLYNLNFNQLLIGRSKKCDLIFLNKELPLHFLTLTFFKNQLIIKAEEKSPHFFINGKKVTGVLKLNRGDLLSFSSHEIKILDFKEDALEDDLSDSFEQFSQKAEDLRFSLEFIEEVLIKLEESKNV